MNQPDSDPLQIERASPQRRKAALQLVFGQAPAPQRDRFVEQALASPDALEGLWTACRGGRVVAAMLAQSSPGKTAILSPARLAADEPAETARQLLRHVIADLQSHGARIAQALLELDHGPDAELLQTCGFRHVSNLLYLVSLKESFPRSQPDNGLNFSSYNAASHKRLAKIVERTYAGSLDCPQIDGARDLDDVLAGYRATGVFDPSRWVIASREGADIGCVLLADHPASDQWELVYMGVVPEARGRGWGLAIVRHAQWLARQADTERLVLAVDAANSPAIEMYAAAGFITWDHRSVFLRVF